MMYMRSLLRFVLRRPTSRQRSLLVGADLADRAAPSVAYCYGRNILIDPDLNKTSVEPFRWSVYNASGIDPASERGSPRGLNVSDTLLYTITFNKADFNIKRRNQNEEYIWVQDLPAGNYYNAYLYDSSDPPVFARYKEEGFYVRHSLSSPEVVGHFPCNRTLFDAEAVLPFDRPSAGTFDATAWPGASPYAMSDAVSVAAGAAGVLRAGAIAAAMVFGGGLLF